jgi:hypothetical protein
MIFQDMLGILKSIIGDVLSLTDMFAPPVHDLSRRKTSPVGCYAWNLTFFDCGKEVFLLIEGVRAGVFHYPVTNLAWNSILSASRMLGVRELNRDIETGVVAILREEYTQNAFAIVLLNT